ncbi:MAG TPA: VWA domain-containing protein [Candidatus Acidoferrum sp.]|nr:VWA domain-containing protein [Candidatus Acidoferrum sp.]
MACALTSFAQSPPDNNASPPTAQSPSISAPSPEPKKPEVETRDTPAVFKVRVNLVLVRVVVRDQKGKVVENLHQEDFALSDGKKPQIVSFFNIETPAAKIMPVTTAENVPAAPAGVAKADLPAIPQRFVSILYDDIHMSLEDSVIARDATTRLFGALAPTDRVGIYTTSGQSTLEFTSDHEALKRTLSGILPKPLFGRVSGVPDCPDISYYQADLIENKNDTQALEVAAAETVDCAFNGDQTKITQARVIATLAAERSLNSGDEESQFVYRHIEDALRRLAGMPGQRVMVFVSPGFILSQLFTEASGIIDRATRSNIVIDTVDVRGLYTPDLLGDIANPPGGSFRVSGQKAAYRTAAQFEQSEILDEFAAGTGGTYFHNRNDVDEGLRQAVAAPPVSYVLGFAPQNLKLDGSYHTLKVTLTGKQKFSVQARKGYFAPRKARDPVETAKQEIEEAIFSQDELKDLAVDLQTQFFKPEPAQAKLSVLAHVDLKSLQFRKADGRNRDDLTLATAIFDDNGNFVTGGEKIVEMRLLDATLDRLGRSGISIKSSFDVKPGSYLVRLVVRDAEGELMAAKNGAVVIPY